MQMCDDLETKPLPGSYGIKSGFLWHKVGVRMPYKSVKVHCVCRMARGFHLSAPSPGDDLRSKSAIPLRGQTVRSDSF